MAEVKRAAGIVRGIKFPELEKIENIFPSASEMDNVCATIVIEDLTVDTSNMDYTSKAHLEIEGVADGETIKYAFNDIDIDWPGMM